MTQQSPIEACHPVAAVRAEVEGSTVPWRYTTVEEEYAALRTRAGVFDHGAIGLLAVTGTGAVPFLQQVLARDVEYLTPEQSMMSLMLDEAGAPVDLVTVYGLEDGMLLETSFGRGEATAKYLTDLLPPGVELHDLGGERVMIGVEGPYAWGVVGRVIDQEFTALPYESVVETDWQGHPVLFARNGFTGEYGYKVVAEIDAAASLWDVLTQDAPPVGYEVLECAMLEVRQPVLHREMQPGDSVLGAGLNWLLDLTKEDFPGREVVVREFEAGPTVQTVGFRCETALPSSGAVVRIDDRPLGHVVHAVHSPGLDATLGLARLDVAFAAADLDVDIELDDGSIEVARTLTAPYVLPQSWSVPVF